MKQDNILTFTSIKKQFLRKIKLDTPKKQQFAFNIMQMNMSKSDVEKTLNKPKEWHLMNMVRSGITYYDGDYNNFIMVSYIKDKVNALYTNQNIITSKSKLNTIHRNRLPRQRLGWTRNQRLLKVECVTNKIIKRIWCFP